MTNNDELEGKSEKIKGKIREGAGKVTGDEGEEIEGKVEQMKGEIQEKTGQVKKKVKEAIEWSGDFFMTSQKEVDNEKIVGTNC